MGFTGLIVCGDFILFKSVDLDDVKMNSREGIARFSTRGPAWWSEQI
jgi:hypothetical protein